MNPLAIDVQVHRLDQLYQTLDPSPFRDLSLDPEFVDWLLEHVVDEGERQVTLRVRAPDLAAEQGATLQRAIHAHFQVLLDRHDRRQRHLARRHRHIILMGLLVLAASLGLQRLFAAWPGPVLDILGEGLLILGWVALWRPLEMGLFDRQEARLRRAALHALAHTEVRWSAPVQPY